MSINLTQLRRLAFSLLTLAAAAGLSACNQIAPDSRESTPPALAQAMSPAATPGQAAAGQTLEGKVVGIADGDTITVVGAGNKRTRVRLQGIDAPESEQAFGQVSKRNLSDLIFGGRVVVEDKGADNYGRILGRVLVGGRDANLEQIKAGLAWHYKYYQNDQSPADRRLYADAEAEARSAKRGLWADPAPIPPWDFRRGKRVAVEGRGRAMGGVSVPTPTPTTRRRAEGQPTGATEPKEETVYVTRTGSKYHRSSCQYLRRSRIPVSLKEAKQSYDPCSVCRPPH